MRDARAGGEPPRRDRDPSEDGAVPLPARTRERVADAQARVLGAEHPWTRLSLERLGEWQRARDTQVSDDTE